LAHLGLLRPVSGIERLAASYPCILLLGDNPQGCWRQSWIPACRL
jgi:hypothetical protein